MRWTQCLLMVAVAAVAAEPKQQWRPHDLDKQQWRPHDLDEGTGCVMTNGGRGVCRLLSQCPDQLAMLHGPHRHRPQICSFRHMSPVVCCSLTVEGDRAPGWSSVRGWPHRQHGPAPPQSPARPPGAGRGLLKPSPTPSPTQMSTPSSAPTSTLPPPTTAAVAQKPTTANSATVGEKSNQACQEYSKQVSKIFNPLIYGGEGTQPGAYPHMALLGYQPMDQKNISWNCGGALISRRFVITAAHCFSDRVLRAPVRVRLGEHDLEEDDDNAVDFGIKRWVIHPEYSARSWYHDLALIELDREAEFGRFIQPACLWTRPQDPPTGLVITGWGSTQQSGGNMSRYLLKGNGTLNRVEPNVCMEFYKTATLQLRQGIQEGILCAMDNMGSVDTCEGDSGGPIQFPTSLGVAYYVVGVVSGGSRWCGSRVPSIYIRIYTYLNWIEKEVWPDN